MKPRTELKLRKIPYIALCILAACLMAASIYVIAAVVMQEGVVVLLKMFGYLLIGSTLLFALFKFLDWLDGNFRRIESLERELSESDGCEGGE